MSRDEAKAVTGTDIESGALNLLVNCVGVRLGQNVLLVGERGEGAFFDADICETIAQTVKKIGARSEIVIVSDPGKPGPFPPMILDALQRVDHAVFFSRLGDRIRFAGTPGRATKTMCYIPDTGYLATPYGQIPYALFEKLSAALVSAMQASRQCTMTCPLGTSLTAAVDGPVVAREFAVKQFPVLIIPPVSCRSMSGRVALSRFLISTSTKAYEDSLMTFDGVVLASVENGHISGFDGPTETVGRIRRHFERVAGACGGDAYALNSWHAGIYPPTYYEGCATDNIERWGDIVFGSPRYTHMHACGSAPGDVCISLFDTTISFDGQDFWRDGRLSFLTTPMAQALLRAYKCTDIADRGSASIGI